MARVRIEFTVVKGIGTGKSMRIMQNACHENDCCFFGCFQGLRGWRGVCFRLQLHFRNGSDRRGRDRGGRLAAPGHGPLQPVVLPPRQVGFLLFRELRQDRGRIERDGIGAAGVRALAEQGGCAALLDSDHQVVVFVEHFGGRARDPAVGGQGVHPVGEGRQRHHQHQRRHPVGAAAHLLVEQVAQGERCVATIKESPPGCSQ